MKTLSTKDRLDTYKLLTRKMDFTGEHQLMYDLWHADFFEFATNRIYANVGEGFSTPDGVKWVVKNAKAEVVATPYDDRDFTPYQDEMECPFVKNEFIIGAGLRRMYEGKLYESLKYISQAFKTPDNHPEYWQLIAE